MLRSYTARAMGMGTSDVARFAPSRPQGKGWAEEQVVLAIEPPSVGGQLSDGVQIQPYRRGKEKARRMAGFRIAS